MADSSFFKNNGTTTQIQNSALTSANNAAASAASVLASEQAAAASAAAAAADAVSTAADVVTTNANVVTSAGHVTSAFGHVTTALAHSTTASGYADSAYDWAVKINGIVDSTDYSSKAYAIGGLGVTGSAGASKEWAILLGSTVDGTDYSAKYHANAAATSATAAAADAVQTAADRVQTGLDRSAAGSSASAASASQISAAQSAAAAANSYDLFDDRYLGSKSSNPSVDNDGNALVAGALVFISTANEMRVYDGSSWIAASSAGGASLTNYNYTATAGQTTFSGSDDNSTTLSYTVDNLIVTRNGVVLEDGADYTATNGTSVVLAVAAAVNDEINIVAFKSFTTSDMVSKTNGGAFSGNVDFSAGIDVTGNITVTGTVDGRDVATDGTKLDAIEAAADVTDTTNVVAALTAGTGITIAGNGTIASTVSGTTNASDLSSGTLPDGRFPATLPATSGVNLTALNASNLGSGTIPDARFPATLPTASGVNLTALNASNLASGTIPDARFPSTLPAISGANLTGIQAGAGYFDGNNGAGGDTTNGKGDIFRVTSKTLTQNVTIASTDNALAVGPLTIDSSTTLTVSGNLTVV